MKRLLFLSALAVVLIVALTGCTKKEIFPVREGLPVKLNGLDYTVFITRELNIRDTEDRDYWPRAPDPPPGSAYYGVFIQVCNDADSSGPITPVNDFRIVDTQGNTFSPTPLPTGNIFAYVPHPLTAKKCLPVAGSIPSSGPTGGLLLVFKLPIATIENRPLDLEIAPPATGIAPKRQRIELDI
jgi:hypothetical protein